MHMGNSFSKKLNRLSLSQTVACQTNPVQDELQRQSASSVLKLESTLLSHRIAPLQIVSKPEMSIKFEPAEIEKLQEKPSESEVVEIPPPQKPLPSRSRGKLSPNGSQVTLLNLEVKVREAWLRDPDMTLHDLFRIAQRLFDLVDDQKKKFINLNKRWCNRLLKSFKGLPNELRDDDFVCSSSHYELFSEPESATMVPTVATSSNQWRQHTKKLLNAKYSSDKKGPKKTKDGKGESITIVNQEIIKTLDNRKQEMTRLNQDLNFRPERRCLQLIQVPMERGEKRSQRVLQELQEGELRGSILLD